MDTEKNYRPGQVIKIRYDFYTHYAIVSDRIGHDGFPMVIDNSAAAGMVKERTWTQATNGARVSLSTLSSSLNPEVVVARARAFIGKVCYSVTGFNCEAFVRKVLGLKPTSKQVAASLIMVPASMCVAHKAFGGNGWLTLLTGCMALAVTTQMVSD